MDVTDVDVISVEMDIRSLEDGGIAPYRGKHTSVESVKRVLIRLETDAGIQGWREIRPSPSVESTSYDP